MEPTSEISLAFQRQWDPVADRVRRFCLSCARSAQDGEDIYQNVAIRVWRGYATFRAESSFLTWVLTIARREAQRGQPRRPTVSLNTDLDVVEGGGGSAAPPLPDAQIGQGWLERMVLMARESGDLSLAESDLLRLRLRLPDMTWDQVGARLKAEGATCAVLHFRALRKLRVFLFTRRLNDLGGPDAASAAYERALKSRDNPLTPEEAAAFRYIVLQQQDNYRKPGWANHLRLACSKIIPYIALP